ncbi:V-type ATP synthase subunit I [Beggiatoa sp. SS]|nr:V-type ATP synthase subunit I [Beggiatoa sp. SS]
MLFAITFILMFGTMFGDVGHGALIATAGWYWRDKLKTFTPFLIAAGFSSILFGFLYGSIFGYEEVLLPALWLSPIHNPNVMLLIALYWGMGFILLATLITVINRWREGDYAYNFTTEVYQYAQYQNLVFNPIADHPDFSGSTLGDSLR